MDFIPGVQIRQERLPGMPKHVNKPLAGIFQAAANITTDPDNAGSKTHQAEISAGQERQEKNQRAAFSTRDLAGAFFLAEAFPVGVHTT